MTAPILRLLFAGVLAILCILTTFGIAAISTLHGNSVTDSVALSGPFASLSIACVTFFLGHSNGVEYKTITEKAADKIVGDASNV